MSDRITYFTKKQILCENWLTDLGFKCRLETDVEQYRVDLDLKMEFNIAIEIDGPSHRKVKKEGNLVTRESKSISKRDRVLLEYFSEGIWHIPVSIEEDTFKNEFKRIAGC